MIRRIMAFILVASIALPACKKSDDTPVPTTLEKVLGKWKVNTIVEEDIIGGTPQTHTYTGLPGDYVDFRADGKVYYNTFGGLDTFTFHILNDQYLVQDVADSFQILTLTNTNFTEYHHSSGSSYKYTENLYK